MGNLLRLDPLGKHSYIVVGSIDNLRILLDHADNQTKSGGAPSSLYPLAASARTSKALNLDDSELEFDFGSGISRRSIVRDHAAFELVRRGTDRSLPDEDRD